MGQTLSYDCCTNQEDQNTQQESNCINRRDHKSKTIVLNINDGLQTPTTGKESNVTQPSSNANITNQDSQFGGFFTNKRKSKNFNEVKKLWTMVDNDDTISENDSKDEFSNSLILIPESFSSKSVPQRNLDDLSSPSSEDQHTVVNPQEKTLDDLAVVKTEQKAREDILKAKKIERQRLIEVLKILLEQQNDDPLESDDEENSKEMRRRFSVPNKKRGNDQQKKLKGQQAHWQYATHINFNKEVPIQPEQNILGPLRDEIDNNPSQCESTILGSVLGAGTSPFKKWSRQRSNTQFNESEIEWSQSNAEDVHVDKWKRLKIYRNMYTTDENNDYSIKRDSQTEGDDSDFKSFIIGLGGYSQQINQVSESQQSQAPVDPQTEVKELSCVSEKDEEKLHSKSNSSITDPEIDQINNHLDILNEVDIDKPFDIGARKGQIIKKAKYEKSGPCTLNLMNFQHVESNRDLLKQDKTRDQSPLIPKSQRSLILKRNQVPSNFDEQIQPSFNPQYIISTPTQEKKESPIDKTKKQKAQPCVHQNSIKGLIKNFKPKERVIQEPDEYTVKDNKTDCAWQRSYKFVRKTENTQKKQKTQQRNLNRSQADIDLKQMQKQPTSPKDDKKIPKSSSNDQLLESPKYKIVRQNSADQLVPLSEANIVSEQPVIQSDIQLQI